MIHTLAIKIVDFLMKYGTAKKSRAIYIYGTECFISECIGNILLFTIAFPLHEEYMMLIWLISFLSIRIHIGGYHANSHWMCLVISTLIGVSSILLNFSPKGTQGAMLLINQHSCRKYHYICMFYFEL